MYRLHHRNRIHAIFIKWAEFAEFWKKLKYKHNLAVESIQRFRLKYWFNTLKSLILLRKNRFAFEQKRKDKFQKCVFTEFRAVVSKSIKLGNAYVKIAVKLRKNIVKEILYKWFYFTEDRLKAKEAIQNEIDLQTQNRILEINKEREEKQKIQQYATDLYNLNLLKRAFKSLQINMAPRKKVIKRLIQKYRLEKLKSKSIQAFKQYINLKRVDLQWKSALNLQK